MNALFRVTTAAISLCLGLWLAPSTALAGFFCTQDADCDDGVFCNGTETCEIATGNCVVVSACPPIFTECLVNGCDEVNDVCTQTPDDALCDDGIFCNGIESCDEASGECVAIGACPAFAVGCISGGGCDEETDTCPIVADDSLCTDEVFCNGVESCDIGSGDCVASSPCPTTVDGCLVIGCDEAGDSCLATIDENLCSGLLAYEFSVSDPEGAVSGDFVYDPGAGDAQLFGTSAAISIHRAEGDMFDYAGAEWNDAVRASGQTLGLNTASPTDTFLVFDFVSAVTLSGPLALEDFDATSSSTAAWIADVQRAQGSNPDTVFTLTLPEPGGRWLAAAALAALAGVARRRSGGVPPT